jgi:hypothetical protein
MVVSPPEASASTDGLTATGREVRVLHVEVSTTVKAPRQTVLDVFENVPGGTRFTVRGDIHLKGWARLLQPLLRGYVRWQIERLQLRPVKAKAEASGDPEQL